MSAPEELKRGRYTLLRALGEGSQGETFEARDYGVRRGPPDPSRLVEEWDRYVARARVGDTPDPRGLVAIKRFRVGKAKAWKDVELAEREARTLASLDHPRLPRYVEHFEEDGALYLVMEMVEGESLAALRAKGKVFGVDDVTRMLEDVGDALRYLHGRAPPVVHRDIKPGNVIRRRDGSYALVDFGAVRDRLKPGGGSTVVGTFGFMAPEQFQGRASSRSDLYGLAATALAMLTGAEPEDLPHEGLGVDVARALPAGTPPGLARALTAMLVPDPDRRAATIDEALALLRAKDAERSKRTREPPRRPSKKEERELARQRKRDARAARRRRRARRAPFLARPFAELGLVIASLAVWLAVGVVTPVVLTLLSVVFGEPLRRAARACVAAARRSQDAVGRASDWLAGDGLDEEAPLDDHARVRVAEDARARVADAPRDDADALDEEEEEPVKKSRRRA